MADLMSGGSGIPPASNGQSTSSTRRPTAPPAQTGSPSGIKGPRMIMQERAAREARQRAEAEQLQQMERARAEQDARLLEAARRADAQRRAAAGVAATQGPSLETQSHTVNPRQQGQPAPETQATGPRVPLNSQIPPQPRPSRVATTQQPPPQFNTSSGTTQPSQGLGGTGHMENTSAPPAGVAKTRNTFPHAFERWETLSAHWEGLTSFWIRKLEQNKDDISRDSINQQLARQVTDLSAAGANLFHAVVELQRLRASSERKFQRWFFETRAELERAQEVNALMEASMEKERRDRADAIRDAVDQERGNTKAQKLVAEMRKELAISKEEARRAWEELGRREQEERDRTQSLQSGQPTIVGGVQVVPMTQSGPSRMREQAQYQPEYAQVYSAPEPPRSQATATTTAPASSGSHHRTEDLGQPEPGRYPSAGSEGGYSEGEYLIDAQGNYILDVHGDKIPFASPRSPLSGSDAEADDYDTPVTTNPPSGPSTTNGTGQWTGAYSQPQDYPDQYYSGQGYGAPGWETVPRHHHPTRLSDVIEEEDERSRTSASQVSRA